MTKLDRAARAAPALEQLASERPASEQPASGEIEA